MKALLKDCVSTDNDVVEMTSYPYWTIVSGSQNVNCCSGIWFSRESAEGYLQRAHYNLPKGASVYRRSANASTDWRALIDAAMKDAGDPVYAEIEADLRANIEIRDGSDLIRLVNDADRQIYEWLTNLGHALDEDAPRHAVRDGLVRIAALAVAFVTAIDQCPTDNEAERADIRHKML